MSDLRTERSAVVDFSNGGLLEMIKTDEVYRDVY